MKKIMKNSKGFTMVELILVITILGILAVAALPQFISVTGAAHDAARDGVVGAVREGIALQHANNMANGSDTYPAILEDAAFASPWFDIVVANGVNDSRWTTADGLTYTYTPSDGSAATTYVYGGAVAGDFTQQ